MTRIGIFAGAAVVASIACGGAPQKAPASPSSAGAAAAVAPAPAVPASIGPEGIADPQPRRVRMVLDLKALRDHPIGRRIGELVASMPQWQEAVHGVVNDPVKEIDWVYLAGPSSANTSKDAIVVHHSLTDASIDKGIDLLHQRSPSVVPYDTGVPGVKATIGTVDVGPRVLLRAQPDLLVIVPPELAKSAAAALVHATVTSPAKGGEALRYWATSPHDDLSMVPDSVKEATVLVIPHADGGMSVSADGSCATEADAQKVAADVSYMIRSVNGFMVRMLTHGILDDVKVSAESTSVHVKLAASQAQLEAIMGFLSTYLGGGKKPAETGATQL